MTLHIGRNVVTTSHVKKLLNYSAQREILWVRARKFGNPSRSTFIWCLLHGCLSTKDILTKLGFSYASICRFFHSCEKSVKHLILFCPFVGFLWQYLGIFFSLRINLKTLYGLILETLNCSLSPHFSKLW